MGTIGASDHDLLLMVFGLLLRLLLSLLTVVGIVLRL